MNWDAERARVRIARNLREIESLWRDMSDEAIEHASDREMPGGEALNQAAPAASPEAWERVFEQIEQAGGDTRYASDQVSARHAHLVVGDWEEKVRHERDQPTGLRSTVPRAVDYLRKNIDWIVVHLDDAPFMDRELSACVAMLENILGAGTRFDTSAAACFKDVGDPTAAKVCGGRLVRRTLQRRDCIHVDRAIAMAKGVADPVTVLRQTLAAFPEDELAHRSCDQGGRDDIYQCRDCGGFYTEAEYWLAVRQYYEQVSG